MIDCSRPASVVVDHGALLAGLPYLISTWKSLKATGVPQILVGTLTKTANEVVHLGNAPIVIAPPDPLAATKDLAVELRDLFASYTSGSIDAGAVKKATEALMIKYPGYPGLPAGWPGGTP